MRNEGDDDRTSGQVLGEQRWTVRGRIVGMRGSRIAKLLVVAPSHWRLHLFIRAWINFLRIMSEQYKPLCECFLNYTPVLHSTTPPIAS